LSHVLDFPKQRFIDLLSRNKIEWDRLITAEFDLQAFEAETSLEGNTLLHLAILQNREDWAKLLSKIPRMARKRNKYGLTPSDLEKFLHRKPFLHEDPLTVFEVAPPHEHLAYPVFESEKIFDQILQKSAKAKAIDRISPEKIWMGIYFNNELENGLHPKVVVKKISDEIGLGVFAAERIRGASFAGEYTGVVREKKMKLVRDNFYCTRYTVWQMGWKKFVLDAEEKGNFTRFINHSEQPNLGLQTIYWRGVPRMIFVALKDIEAGDQLSFNYGNLFWKECKKKPFRI
jgi:hypothetical protein